MSPGVIRIDPHPPPASLAPTNLVDPALLISGEPNDRGGYPVHQPRSTGGCGVWTCDVYKERIPSYPVDELFVVLEGEMVVTVDGSEPETFRPGDAFVLEKGTPCTLDVRAPFRKYWMTIEAEARSSP
jgi:uncharacterized cupin superfamily protein